MPLNKETKPKLSVEFSFFFFLSKIIKFAVHLSYHVTIFNLYWWLCNLVIKIFNYIIAYKRGLYISAAQLAGAVEYTDCISAEG